MQRIKEFYLKFEYRIYFVLSLLLGLTPLAWFHGKIIAGEEFYALNYGRWTEMYSKAWSPFLNYGEESVLVPIKLQGIFFSMLKIIGVPYYFAEIFWYVLLWTLTAAFFYLLLNKIFKKSVSGLAMFVVTVYYVYSPFFLNISPLLTPSRIVFIALPAILSLLYSFFEEKVVNPVTFLKISVVLFFASPAFVNVPTGSVLLVITFLAILYRFLLIKFSPKKLLISFGYFLGFTLVLSLWWIYPVIRATSTSLNSIKATSSEFSAVSNSKTFDVLSQFGSWAFREKIWGYDYDYFPYYKSFDSFPLAIIRYLPFGLILLSAFFLILNLRRSNVENTKQDFIVFLFLLFFIFSFLSKGTSGLFGNLYELFMRIVPMFWIYREPYAKFMPVASVAAGTLLLFGFEQIAVFTKKIKWIYPTILLTSLVAFLALGFPFWTGGVIWNINDKDVRSYEIQMPNYWKEFLSKWNYRGGNYLLYPSSFGLTTRYDWPSGYIGNAFLMLTRAKTINQFSSYILNNGVQKVITYLFNTALQDPKNFTLLAKRYNISGISFQSDGVDQGKQLKRGNFLNSYKNNLELSVGKLDSYSFLNKNEPASDFALIPENDFLHMDSKSIDDYDLFKKILPSNVYIIFSSDNQKDTAYVLGGELGQPNQINYSLSNLNKNSYVGYFYDPHNTIKSSLLDKNSVLLINDSLSKYFVVDFSGICCTELNLNIDSPKELPLQSDWTIIENIDNAHYRQGNAQGTQLDLRSINFGYYKKIEGFDPHADVAISITGDTVGNDGFGVFVVQRDKDVMSDQVLVGGTLAQIKKSVTFSLQAKDFINSSYNSEYYLVFKRPQNSVPVTQVQNSLNIDALKMYMLYNPKLVLVEKNIISNLTNAVVDPEERVIDDTMLLVNTKNQTSSYLQFKNSYNSGWRLVKISQVDWDSAEHLNLFSKSILSTKLSLRAFSGKEPENIEFYSNGWKLNSDSSGYAVIFLPNVIIKILFDLAVVTILVFIVKGILKKHA